MLSTRGVEGPHTYLRVYSPFPSSLPTKRTISSPQSPQHPWHPALAARHPLPHRRRYRPFCPSSSPPRSCDKAARRLRTFPGTVRPFGSAASSITASHPTAGRRARAVLASDAIMAPPHRQRRTGVSACAGVGAVGEQCRRRRRSDFREWSTRPCRVILYPRWELPWL